MELGASDISDQLINWFKGIAILKIGLNMLLIMRRDQTLKM